MPQTNEAESNNEDRNSASKDFNLVDSKESTDDAVEYSRWLMVYWGIRETGMM